MPGTTISAVEVVDVDHGVGSLKSSGRGVRVAQAAFLRQGIRVLLGIDEAEHDVPHARQGRHAMASLGTTMCCTRPFSCAAGRAATLTVARQGHGSAPPLSTQHGLGAGGTS